MLSYYLKTGNLQSSWNPPDITKKEDPSRTVSSVRGAPRQLQLVEAVYSIGLSLF